MGNCLKYRTAMLLANSNFLAAMKRGLTADDTALSARYFGSNCAIGARFGSG